MTCKELLFQEASTGEIVVMIIYLIIVLVAVGIAAINDKRRN